MSIGVGMPAHFYLHLFGMLIYDAFDEVPYLVGTSLTSKTWRDVDVRLILDEEKWDRFIGEKYEEGNAFPNGSRRASLEMAFAALGKHITGLPIDFQIQQRERANKTYDRPRSALGLRLMRETSDPLLSGGEPTPCAVWSGCERGAHHEGACSHPSLPRPTSPPAEPPL